MTHICVGNLIIIGLDNGLSPGQRQAIIWTNAGILLIGPSGTNFSEILIEILTFSFKNMRFKMSSAKWWPFCLGLNVLSRWQFDWMKAGRALPIIPQIYAVSSLIGHLGKCYNFPLMIHVCCWTHTLCCQMTVTGVINGGDCWKW